jgi:hypothetical protein
MLAVLDAASLQLALTRTLPRQNAAAILLNGSQALEVVYVMTQRHTKVTHRIPFAGIIFKSSPIEGRFDTKQPGFAKGEIAVEIASTADAVNGLPSVAVNKMIAGESQPISLTRAEFDHAVEILRVSGYPIENDLDTAWEQFTLARGRYEFTAYQLALRLDVVPAPWSGPRSHNFPTVWPSLASSFLKNDDA